MGSSRAWQQVAKLAPAGWCPQQRLLTTTTTPGVSIASVTSVVFSVAACDSWAAQAVASSRAAASRLRLRHLINLQAQEGMHQAYITDVALASQRSKTSGGGSERRQVAGQVAAPASGTSRSSSRCLTQLNPHALTPLSPLQIERLELRARTRRAAGFESWNQPRPLLAAAIPEVPLAAASAIGWPNYAAKQSMYRFSVQV